MLIAIDHGNKQMKTIHKTFTSALKESDTRPPFGEDILEYQGKYYSLTGNRIPYLRDKTVDERFFLLTLFAIAFEIEEAGVYSADEIIDVQLAVGLPPAHFGAQADRFERYFLNRDVVSFTFRGKPYEVYINKVLCFPQAYAATIPIYDRIRKTTKAVVVDIGGFTADYLVFKNGEADLDACDSLENGVIILYNHIKSKLNGEMDMLLEESDIDAILQGDTSDFDNEVVQIVRQQAQGFVNDLVGKLRERMVDLRTGKAIFIGGGSILLRQQIESCEKIGTPVFLDQIYANARGYELLYRAAKSGR